MSLPQPFTTRAARRNTREAKRPASRAAHGASAPPPYLAHKVGADVGGLGEDAAPKLGEERHEGRPEAVPHQHQRHLCAPTATETEATKAEHRKRGRANSGVASSR